MIKTIKITYEEFLKIKANRYDISAIKRVASKHLNCSPLDIEDVDWNFKLTFDVYLFDPMEDDTLPF